jgi:uncharacterized protein YjbJ (UPF0337 family)
MMNWDELKGDWKNAAGKLKTQWGKLTDDDMTQINGKREELSGRLQKTYGHSKEQAEKHIDNFLKTI